MHLRFVPFSKVATIVAITGSLVLSQNTDFEDWKGFDRATCFRRVIGWLQNETNTDNTTALDAFFFERPSKNQSDMVLLKVLGCEYFCGKPSLYFDAVSRVTIWTIPILLLLSNIQLAPFSKKRFATILHALGDPIDSLWSLVQKAYVWHRLYQISLEAVKATVQAAANAAATAHEVAGPGDDRPPEPGVELVNMAAPATGDGPRDLSNIDIGNEARVIATVLSGLEELSGPQILSEAFYIEVINRFYQIDGPESSVRVQERRRKWAAAATELVNGRTSDLLHTGLGLAVYYFGIASALVDTLGGGGGTPPGGRIACAIFLSWLVPLALLSNTFGAFSSRITCLDVMVRFFEPVAGEELVTGDGENLRDVSNWKEYFDSAMWTGAMHTFRPWKVTYRRYPNPESRVKDWALRAVMAVIAFFPPLVSMLGAVVIIYYAIPQAFTCRHVWVLVVFGFWILSAFLTNVRYGHVKNTKVHWWLIFCKDTVIGIIGSIAFPVASTIGAWNKCSCWSSAWPSGNGFIPVGVEKGYKARQDDVYSKVIIATQVSHLVFFLMVLLLYRHALKVVWWGSSHVQRQWEANHEELSWSRVLARYLRFHFQPVE